MTKHYLIVIKIILLVIAGVRVAQAAPAETVHYQVVYDNGAFVIVTRTPPTRLFGSGIHVDQSLVKAFFGEKEKTDAHSNP